MKIKISNLFFTVIIGLLVTGCFNSCYLVVGILYSGTAPGYISNYEYGISKEILQNNIIKFLEENPKYKVSKKWEKYIVHVNTTKEIIFYFDKYPEELYSVRFLGDEEYWQKYPYKVTLSLQGTVKWNKKWRFYNEFKLWYRGKKRIEKRFETEILSKLKYSYTKIK